MHEKPLEEAFRYAVRYLDGVAERPVASSPPGAATAALRERLGGPLPENGVDPSEVIRAMTTDLEPGIVTTVGPRYFGFVIGGVLPAALAADWLSSTWDQNAALNVASPAAAVVESVVAEWLVDLFGLPAQASVGFVTGGQMANFTGLTAGRDEVLRRHGWDLEQQGLSGAPEITVVLGAEAHATIYTALRFLGIGRRQIRSVEADDQGRMKPSALRKVLDDCKGPIIVSAQAGCVNTGAFDPMAEIAEAAHARDAWMHVDGAFGLWAAASAKRRGLTASIGDADSWAVDGHKWLNVPYDSGIAIVRDAAAHVRALRNVQAAYLVEGSNRQRDGQNLVPESSRRARGFPIYAALRSLGRRGLADLVDRCCDLATLLADQIRTIPGARVLNDVVLNQVLVRFHGPESSRSRLDAAELTTRIIGLLQEDGTCWLGPTVWDGAAAMRISISNWQTTEADIERTFAAIAKAASQA